MLRAHHPPKPSAGNPPAAAVMQHTMKHCRHITKLLTITTYDFKPLKMDGAMMRNGLTNYLSHLHGRGLIHLLSRQQSLDCFVGSGTTVAVAQSLGRRGVGLDLNPEYLAIAQRRIEAIPLPLLL